MILKPAMPLSPATKPKKPYPDFPLFAHQNGQWCKKIRSRQHDFGLCKDPNDALDKYLNERDDLQAGRIPQRTARSIDLADVCNAFLTRQESRLKNSEISARTFRDYREVCQLIVNRLGRSVDPEQLRPIDFAKFREYVASRYSPARISKTVTITRMVLTWAYESELIETLPRFEPDFKGASRRAVREQKSANGEKFIEAADIQRLLGDAGPAMRAMILLGIDGGLGNTDIATLPIAALDLRSGWIDFLRPKTGINRRVPLGKETESALRETIAVRPRPKNPELENRVFLTRFGNPWVSETGRSDQVSVRFCKLINWGAVAFYNRQTISRHVLSDRARRSRGRKMNEFP